MLQFSLFFKIFLRLGFRCDVVSKRVANGKGRAVCSQLKSIQVGVEQIGWVDIPDRKHVYLAKREASTSRLGQSRATFVLRYVPKPLQECSLEVAACLAKHSKRAARPVLLSTRPSRSYIYMHEPDSPIIMSRSNFYLNLNVYF